MGLLNEAYKNEPYLPIGASEQSWQSHKAHMAEVYAHERHMREECPDEGGSYGSQTVMVGTRAQSRALYGVRVQDGIEHAWTHYEGYWVAVYRQIQPPCSVWSACDTKRYQWYPVDGRLNQVKQDIIVGGEEYQFPVRQVMGRKGVADVNGQSFHVELGKDAHGHEAWVLLK